MATLTPPTVVLSLFHVDAADGVTLSWGLSSEPDTRQRWIMLMLANFSPRQH